MTERGFEILFEDDAVLGVVKPAGVATQAPPGIDSLEVRIKTYLAAGESSRDVQANGPREASAIYLGIPHRLDRAVTGAIVFAKTRRAARQLSKQFERRSVKKTYWAAVERIVEPAAGTWIDYLHKVYGQPSRGGGRKHASRRTGSDFALSHAGLSSRRFVARDRAGDWPHASDSRAGRHARTSGARRRALWIANGVRPGI